MDGFTHKRVYLLLNLSVTLSHANFVVRTGAYGYVMIFPQFDTRLANLCYCIDSIVFQWYTKVISKYNEEKPENSYEMVVVVGFNTLSLQPQTSSCPHSN